MEFLDLALAFCGLWVGRMWCIIRVYRSQYPGRGLTPSWPGDFQHLNSARTSAVDCRLNRLSHTHGSSGGVWAEGNQAPLIKVHPESSTKQVTGRAQGLRFTYQTLYDAISTKSTPKVYRFSFSRRNPKRRTKWRNQANSSDRQIKNGFYQVQEQQ